MTLQQINTSSTIAEVNLSNYIINASGPRCTTEDELINLAQSDSAAIMTKSCTLLPRSGNPEPRYQTLEHGSVQSMGLPNLGYQAYLDMLPRLKQYNKPVIVSISGLSISDNVEMVSKFQQSEADLLEVNFSCPNVPGKPQLGYDFEQTEKALAAITKLGDKPLGIKLPAYFDMNHFETVANILKKFPIKFISSINSIGNTLVIDADTESTIIKPNSGLGGLCGSYIKPIGLANVRTFRSLLPKEICIFGVGGVYTGIDAFEYLLAGADAVQVATCYQEQGSECFTRLNNELSTILASKGYKDINEVKGKLQTI
ncbi:dihydroorotate oxidase [Thalassotalea crassostreae]|uniref:dihydroorotate oxidase n=1 Tax=Thalassotalea crassostreae TaxID=1763536 RepID=UPI0008387749|nr:dihydroorotate oxidase [Thalassotalea crassostreae]